MSLLLFCSWDSWRAAALRSTALLAELPGAGDEIPPALSLRIGVMPLASGLLGGEESIFKRISEVRLKR